MLHSCGDGLSNLLKPKDQNRFSDSGGSNTTSYADKISTLEAGGSGQTTVELIWIEPSNTSGVAITDYEIVYRVKGTSVWLTYTDGTSTDTYTSVSGLTPGTTYQFRVFSTNGNLSPGSNIAEVDTKPSLSVFDSGFAAVNTGGATSSTVAAIEDNTNITLNGGALVTLNKGQTHNFVSAQWDVIDADKQVFVSGGAGNANHPWMPAEWAGKNFVFSATRQADTEVYIYAFEQSDITIYQGSTTLQSLTTINANNGSTFTISTLGSYQIVSDGLIVASTKSNLDYDPKAIPPTGYKILGFPSQSMSLSTIYDNTEYEYIHSNGTDGSGTISAADDISISPQGATTTNYNCEALFISGDRPMGGASYDDGDGNDSAAFYPLAYMKTKFILNVKVEYIAFASNQPASIQVYDTAGNPSGPPITLSRTGTGDAPYFGKGGSLVGGASFISDVPIAVWYHPHSVPDAGSVASDITIMYGSN